MPSPEAALFVLGVVNSVCREQLLFQEVSPLGRRAGDAGVLERRLVDLVERELAGEVAGARSGRRTGRKR